MLLDLHRNVLTGQESNDNQQQPVSATPCSAFNKTIDHPLDSSQVSGCERHGSIILQLT